MSPFFPGKSSFREILYIGHSDFLLLTRGYFGLAPFCGLIVMVFAKLLIMAHIPALRDYALGMGGILMYMIPIHILHRIFRHRVYRQSVRDESTGHSWVYLRFGLTYEIVLLLEPVTLLVISVLSYQHRFPQGSEALIPADLGLFITGISWTLANFLEYGDLHPRKAIQPPPTEPEPLAFSTASFDNKE